MYNKNRETLEAYVLGDDFKYFQNLKYLPLSVYPSNIQSALVVYCFSGKAKLNVYDDSHWIAGIDYSVAGTIRFVHRGQ